MASILNFFKRLLVKPKYVKKEDGTKCYKITLKRKLGIGSSEK